VLRTDDPLWLPDSSKNIKGKKRHLLVDTQGLLMATLFGLHPFLLKLLYQHWLSEIEISARTEPGLLRCKRRNRAQCDAEILSERWIVKRMFSCPSRDRHLSKD